MISWRGRKVYEGDRDLLMFTGLRRRRHTHHTKGYPGGASWDHAQPARWGGEGE